jgi:hypothetical protein
MIASSIALMTLGLRASEKFGIHSTSCFCISAPFILEFQLLYQLPTPIKGWACFSMPISKIID